MNIKDNNTDNIKDKIKLDSWALAAIKSKNFESYQHSIMHDWLRTLTILGSLLIPLFFVLDIFMMPVDLLPKFGIYRAISTAIIVFQIIIVRRTNPSKFSYIHGYLLSLHVGGMIALMSADLGGFSSSYYAGLNLVIIAVNLLMPWHEIHTFNNAASIIIMYVLINVISGSDIIASDILNNLFFLGATSVLSIGINYVRFRLIHKEFYLLTDLDKAHDTLEEINKAVIEKGKSIKSLLDLSGQGFLSFNSQMLISADYSKECTQIFGKEIENLPLDEILYTDSAARLDFITGLSLFFTGKVKAAVIFDQLDSRFTINDKIISAAYMDVHANKVMMVLTDITEETRLLESSRRSSEIWSMIRKAISNRQAFNSFDKETKNLFQRLQNNKNDFSTFLPELHTLKSSAGFLGFIKTQSAAHIFESFLADMLTLEKDIHPKKYIDNLVNSFVNEMEEITDQLGKAWRLNVDIIEIKKTDLQEIDDYIKTHAPNLTITNFIDEHYKKPLSQLLARFPKMAQELAVKFGKRLAPYKIIGGDITVAYEDYEELIDTFSHIIRNSMDHGIEIPSERENKGKPPAGYMFMEIVKNLENIVFKFSDDGRGLQFEDIEKKVNEKKNNEKNNNSVHNTEKLSHQKLVSYIFSSNFSTSKTITEISGRGVGLAAVQQAVKKMSGKIMVRTTLGKGVLFSLSIPINRKINLQEQS